MRSFRRLIAGLALVVVLCAGWYAYLQHRATQRLEESERIAQRMLAVELAADQTHPTLATPVEDVDARLIYDEVLARASALDQDEKDMLFSLSWAHERHTPAEERAEFDALLDKTQPIVARLRAVMCATRLSPPPYLGVSSTAPVETIPAWVDLSTLLACHVQRHVVRAEIDRALDLCALRWLCGRDIALGGGFVSYLVGHATVSAGARSMRRILADCEVGAERLERLARELEMLRRAMPSEDGAWRRDEIGARRQLQEQARMGSGKFDIDDDMLGLSNVYSHRLLIADALEALRGARESYLSTVAGKPGLAAVAAAETYAQTVRGEGNPLVSMVVDVGPILAAAASRAAMVTDLLRVTVALARHRERHGKLPATLDELVPAFLPAIPTCAYTGAALRYDGDRVWSIGGNAKDDGGVPLPLGDVGEEDDGGDVVFTLHRRGLQTFPWPEDVDAATRARVEDAIKGLTMGGRDGRLAREVLATLGRSICGRLISEFKAIADSPGFDSVEGRSLAGALDASLREIDRLMERRWEDPGRIRATSDPAFVHKIALRWTNWWYRRAWEPHPLDPWTALVEED